MKLIAPSYYQRFRCIAGKCRHSCCKGWEIDIDSVSVERFKRLGVGSISEEGTPHFILREGDVCHHLRSDGLCQLICDHGEDVLCDICRDHPRFRNFWTGFAEVGLGLSCEEAARIILSEKEPLRLVPIGLCGDDGVQISAGLEQDGGLSAVEGEGSAFDPAESEPDFPEDEAWLWELRESMLGRAAAMEDPMAARLYEYLVFRHLADALYDGRLEGRIGFIEHAFETVTGLWSGSPDKSFEALAGIARQWSEEIEYNEEKKDALIERFESSANTSV